MELHEGLLAAIVLFGILAGLSRLLRPKAKRKKGAVQVDFEGYKDQEIKQRGHYHKIVL